MEGLQISQLLDQFCALYHEMVATLSDVFPECDTTAAAKEAAANLRAAPEDVRDDFVRKWNAAMKLTWSGATFYRHVTARNGAIFQRPELPFTRTLVLWPKWTDPDFVEESKDALWLYIDQLNKISRYYSMIPRALFDKLAGVMNDLVSFDADGHFTLTPGTDFGAARDRVLAAIGGENALTEEQLHDITANIGDVMADILGPSGENLPRLLAAAGLPNIDPALAMGLMGQLTGLMGGAQAPGGGGMEMLSRMLENVPPGALQQLAGALQPPPR